MFSITRGCKKRHRDRGYIGGQTGRCRKYKNLMDEPSTRCAVNPSQTIVSSGYCRPAGCSCAPWEAASIRPGLLSNAPTVSTLFRTRSRVPGKILVELAWLQHTHSLNSLSCPRYWVSALSSETSQRSGPEATSGTRPGSGSHQLP